LEDYERIPRYLGMTVVMNWRTINGFLDTSEWQYLLGLKNLLNSIPQFPSSWTKLKDLKY